VPLHPNNVLLIDTLQALPLLDGRFANLKVVNCNVATGEKRGCFSIVFRADDTIEGKPVALKFFDLNPSAISDVYRRTAFERESKILQTLLTRERCLQLVKAESHYILNFPGGFALPCSYFAVEWLDEEVDEYFLGKSLIPSADKLRLFIDILLAIEALHGRDVFHRDIKADNIRAVRRAVRRIVVAIDLGTAARLDSPPIGVPYAHAVGAPAYAAAESICGLAGNRTLAPLTDHYALGCLLFELFNRDFFFVAVQTLNPSLHARYSAIALGVTEKTDPLKQIAQLKEGLKHYARGVAPVSIDGVGSTCDPATAGLLNDVLARLTHIDYRERDVKLEWVRQRIGCAVRVLENEKAYQLKLRASRERKAKRIQRALELDARIRNRQLSIH
jgi:serine/threonine protein kinase